MCFWDIYQMVAVNIIMPSNTSTAIFQQAKDAGITSTQSWILVTVLLAYKMVVC